MAGAVCRKGFPEVQAVTSHAISAMRKARGAQLPLEKAALCVTLDVIGRVGFQKDFGATASFEAAIEGTAPAPSGECPLAQLALLRSAYLPLLHLHVQLSDSISGTSACQLAVGRIYTWPLL